MDANTGKRVQVILTDDIQRKLMAIAKSRGSTFSATARIALAEWLQRNHGVTVDPHLQRGGDRPVPTQ